MQYCKTLLSSCHLRIKGIVKMSRGLYSTVCMKVLHRKEDINVLGNIVHGQRPIETA